MVRLLLVAYVHPRDVGAVGIRNIKMSVRQRDTRGV
jgi:hypothetical protein